jgi:putative transposase
MLRVHKIRLQPTAAQERYFAQACGTARFAYNWALAEWRREYEAGGKPNEAVLRRKLNSIKADQFPWMSEVTKVAPQQAIKNLGTAFQHFFRRVKLGQKPGYPRFKKKGLRESFRADNGPAQGGEDAIESGGMRVKFPRCGWVRMREALRFLGQIKSATISRMADGWYVALLIETEQRLCAKQDLGVVGVDLGIKALATLSTGEVVIGPKPRRALDGRLRRLGRSLSRKQKGSANRQKAKAKLSQLHLRISNIRKDALHKLTTQLATAYSVITIEDLNVRGMVRNRSLARSVSDAGFGEFRQQLEYKAAMTGSKVIVVNRWFPSSKTCSSCGVIHNMPLSARVMRCQCGNVMDRDLNAAINIMRQALPSQPVERKALAGASAPVKPASTKQEITDLSRNAQAL